MRDRRVLLLGMMGAGKTSVGRAIEARTGWPYRDNDQAVAVLTGLPTQELQVLHDALVAAPPYVAGVAGGVVESAADVQALRDGDAFVVYLHTPVDELVR